MSWFRDTIPEGGYPPTYNGGYSSTIGQSRTIPACVFAIVAAISGRLAGEIGTYSAGFAIFLAISQILQDLRVRKVHNDLIKNTQYTLDTADHAKIAAQSAQQAADLSVQLDARLAQIEGKQ